MATGCPRAGPRPWPPCGHVFSQKKDHINMNGIHRKTYTIHLQTLKNQIKTHIIHLKRIEFTNKRIFYIHVYITIEFSRIFILYRELVYSVYGMCVCVSVGVCVCVCVSKLKLRVIALEFRIVVIPNLRVEVTSSPGHWTEVCLK